MFAVADLHLDTKKIRQLRNALDLTMEQAAEAAGFTSGRQYWYQLESGRQTDVPISTLGRIAKALKCKPEDLLK
jgi:transcriptional regulator with XRE-family HTH domain